MKIIRILNTEKEKRVSQILWKNNLNKCIIFLKNPNAYIFSTVGYAEFEYMVGHPPGGLRQFLTLIHTKEGKIFQDILVVYKSMSYFISSTTHCTLHKALWSYTTHLRFAPWNKLVYTCSFSVFLFLLLNLIMLVIAKIHGHKISVKNPRRTQRTKSMLLTAGYNVCFRRSLKKVSGLVIG